MSLTNEIKPAANKQTMTDSTEIPNHFSAAAFKFSPAVYFILLIKTGLLRTVAERRVRDTRDQRAELICGN
jgi:hypothetical protein